MPDAVQEGKSAGSREKITLVKQNPWESEFGQDLLKYDTVIVSVGLTNFEEGRFSRKKHTRYKEGIGKHRISAGYLDNQECMEDFRASMKDNYPELCKDRNIIVIDCTNYVDPGQDKSLRSHIGRHHTTMERIVDNEKFAEVNKPLRDLRRSKKNLVVNVCTVGRHRSVANSELQVETIRQNLYNHQDSVATIDLQADTHWKGLCAKGCPSCDVRSEKHHGTFDKAHDILKSIVSVSMKAEPVLPDDVTSTIHRSERSRFARYCRAEGNTRS